VESDIGRPDDLVRTTGKRKGEAFRRALEEGLDEGRRAWPGVEVPAATFQRHVADRLPEEDDPLAALGQLHLADLYLACACGRGDPRALAAFEERLMPQVRVHVARLDARPAFADEVQQLVRERLFVASPGKAPRIDGYQGRGPLGGWLRIAAIRVAHNLLRRDGSSDGAATALLDRLADAGPGPETSYVKRRYGRLLKEVVEEVLRALPADERTVLRLHLCDGLTVVAIGKLYRVHGATVTRWIARARQAVTEATRERLRRDLSLDARDLESLLALVQSRVDLTLSRILETSR
jgi:RNA polymerase sigma-70 factor (ECF subfamily)